jgi:hypothetical protein
MAGDPNHAKALLKCLGDLRWAFKSFGKQVVSGLGEERAQLGEASSPTWQYMGDDSYVGYTDGQLVELASGVSILAEVSLFWTGGNLRVAGAISAAADEEEGEHLVQGLARLETDSLDLAIAELVEIRQKLMAAAGHVISFVDGQGLS